MIKQVLLIKQQNYIEPNLYAFGSNTQHIQVLAIIMCSLL